MSANGSLSHEQIQQGLVAILDDMVQDWDLDLMRPIGPDSRIIGELGFESIDLVQLVVAIESKFAVRGLPYEELIIEDGRYVTEMTVNQVADFLYAQIGTQ